MIIKILNGFIFIIPMNYKLNYVFFQLTKKPMSIISLHKTILFFSLIFVSFSSCQKEDEIISLQFIGSYDFEYTINEIEKDLFENITLDTTYSGSRTFFVKEDEYVDDGIIFTNLYSNGWDTKANVIDDTYIIS